MIIRMKKNIIAAIVAVFSVAASCIPVSAFSTEMPQDTDTSRFKPAIEMCTMLNIMQISESMEFEGDTIITRGDLAGIALGMLNLKGTVNADGSTAVESANGQTINTEWMGSALIAPAREVRVQKFSDVGFDDKNYATVQFISDLGIMTGYDDGTFRPNEPVVYRDMMKVLVTVLGYSVYAEYAGGYPDGYISTAASLELGRYVSLNENSTVTKEQAAVMVCNALETDICDEDYEIQKGENLLNKYFNVEKVTGHITALERTGLYSEASDVGENGVKIDSEIYADDGLIGEDMLGKRVTCYYEMDEMKILYVLEKESDNTVISIAYSDFESFSGNRLRYYVHDSSKQKTASMADNAPVIVNGVYEDIIGNIDFGSFADYSTDMRLLDSDGNGTYDVLFINSYETYVVRSVNSEEGRIFVSDVTDPMSNSAVITNDASTRYSPIDLEDGTEYRFFKDGTETTAAGIKPEIVISVARSRNIRGGQYADIHISTEKVSGTITSFSDDEIRINDTVYEIVPRANLVDLKTGYTGTLYLDANGKVAAYTVDSSAYDYAILMKGAIDDDGETVLVKMFRKNTELVEKLKLASRLTLNGKSTDAMKVFDTLGGQAMQNRLIAYKINEKNEVSQIITPTVYNNWNYTGNDIKSGVDVTIDRMNVGILSTYTNTAGDAGPGVRGIRRCFRTFFTDFIPADDVMIFDLSSADERSWQVKTGSSNLVHNRQYDCAAYNISYCNVASIMVIFPGAASVSTKVKDVSYYDSDCVIVSGVQTSVNDEGTIVTEISGYVMGKPVVYTMEYDENKERADKIDKGDVWQIEYDNRNNVVGASEIFDSRCDYSKLNLSRQSLMGTSQSSVVYERTVGIVKEVGANSMVIGIDENSTNQGDYYKAPGITTESGITSDKLWITKIGVYGAGSTNVYWYDAKRKEVELKGINDIEPNDLVFVSSDYGAPRQILVIKNYQ